MKVVSLSAAKGGAGKSSLTVHLASLADAEEGPAGVVDIDPQGSATAWYRHRQKDTPGLKQCSSRDLASTLAKAKQAGIRWAFVDTDPRDNAAGAVAMRAADLVLIPLRPSAFDLAAVVSTIDQAKKLGRPYAVVLNAAAPRRGIGESTEVTEFKRAMKNLGAPVMDAVISQRNAIKHAVASGQAVHELEPGGKAADEMQALWIEIKQHFERKR